MYRSTCFNSTTECYVKCNPVPNTYEGTKVKSDARALQYIDPHNLTSDTRLEIILIFMLFVASFARKLCRSERGVLKSRTCFHSGNYFTPKAFTADREAFSSAYRKPSGNKISGHVKCL